MSDIAHWRGRPVAVIGGGVIGAGWAARLLLNGIDVRLFDPGAGIAERMQAVLDMARAAWGRLVPEGLGPEGTLTYCETIAEAVRGVVFVQESLPEIETLKKRVLGEIDAALPAGIVIGTSTSGLLPTRLQADLAHPERLVVGHPFNPVYLLPLVEICGGEKTAPETLATAGSLYRAIGMQVLHVRKEIDGFIADRLLEAVWREGLWLIEEGVATTSELDDAIRYGAGLRWAFMGTFLTYRLAGGDAGMRHFLSQFGPALKLPWTKLVAPELTDELVERIATQSDEQAEGSSVRALEVIRNEALAKLILALETVTPEGYAAGATLKAYRPARKAADAATRTTWQGAVDPAWIDYNGHMTESRYLHVFGEASDALLAAIGAGLDYVSAGYSFYTVETHLRHVGQGHAGQSIAVETGVISGTGKKLHFFHILRAGDEILATAEMMMLHVDAQAEKTVAMPPAMEEAITPWVVATCPDWVGRSVGMKG